MYLFKLFKIAFPPTDNKLPLLICLHIFYRDVVLYVKCVKSHSVHISAGTGSWSTMRVLTNPQIKFFHANLFKRVFIDLNQLTGPLNDV